MSFDDKVRCLEATYAPLSINKSSFFMYGEATKSYKEETNMRILKRNLAFMLAMIMALSLTAFAGYEDYTDVNELTYVEAVDVLTELGIVAGSDGALNPTGNLTRAQAAKLIAYTMLGQKAADALQADVAPFVDVPAYHWAAGYVEYCADQGIVGGMGDGTFAPESNVTASQFAKMLLCAVGYGEKGEFTGLSWDSTVNAQGTKLGIFDGNEDNVVFAKAVTREEAFLYTFNALTKVMEVTYSADADEYYAGTVFNSIKGFDFDETLGAKLYDLNTKDATDVFGRECYNWYKGAKKIAGMYHEAPAAVYTAAVKSGTIFTDLDLDNTTVATVWNNGEKENFQVKKSSATKIGGNGVLIEAYVDADMNVTLIRIDTYLAQVEDILDEDVTLTVFGHATVADQVVELDMDLVDDQYVLVTIVDDEIQTVATLETVNGVLDAHGATSTYTKMDGTKYSHSAHLAQNVAAAYEVKYDDAEMVMMFDEYGYMIGLKPVSTTEKMDGYVLVTDSELRAGTLASAGKALVEVMWLDGTGYEVLSLQTKRTGTGNARVTKYLAADGEWYTISADANDVVAYGFYGYTMTENGEIVLKALNKTKANETVVYGDVVKAEGKQQFVFGNDALNLVLDNESVMNLVTSKEVKSFEGYKNIKIDENDVDALAIYKGRTVETLYVVDGSLVDKDLYVYYNGTEFEKSGSKTYIPVYMDGELKYFTFADITVGGGVNAPITMNLPVGVYKINLEGSKIVKMDNVLTKAWSSTVVKSVASNGKYFTVEGVNVSETNVTYADGVKVYDMTKDGVEIEKVVKGDTIVYFNNSTDKGEVATHIWVVKHNKKADITNDTLVNNDVVLAAKDATSVTLKVTGAGDAGVQIDAYHANGALFAMDMAATWNHVSGTTYTAKVDVANVTDLFFVINVNGEEFQTEVLHFN